MKKRPKRSRKLMVKNRKPENRFMRMGFETRRRKTCRFCENRIDVIDYKDERLLRRFINERGKIVPRRISGNCAWHQRRLTTAVKRARHIALIPFTHEVYR